MKFVHFYGNESEFLNVPRALPHSGPIACSQASSLPCSLQLFDVYRYGFRVLRPPLGKNCLLYTSDAADE